MSFLHLVNEALLHDRPQVMAQVLVFLQQKRFLDAAQLLQQHAKLPRSDVEDFIAHHVQGGEMSANFPSGQLLTAVHTAMQRGDTHHAVYLLQAAQSKALGMKAALPNSLKELIHNMLTTLLVGFMVCAASAVALLMWVRSWRW
jgi:hypothetical protein